MMAYLLTTLVILLTTVGCGDIDPGSEIPGQPPLPPSELRAEPNTTTSILLTWMDNSTIEESYQIERMGGPEGNSYQKIGEVEADVTSFEDATITTDWDYTYRVRASNQKGFSTYSNEELIIAAPTALKAIYDSGGDPPRFFLTWADHSTQETSFVVRRKIATGMPSSYETIATLPTNSTSFADPGPFANNTKYCYIVDAYNGEEYRSSKESCDTTPDPKDP